MPTVVRRGATTHRRTVPSLPGMARGRHARRGWLRAWLAPVEAPPPRWRAVHAQSLVRLSDDLTAVQAEVERLRGTTSGSTAAQVVAELRAQRLEDELATARAEIAALRRDLDALREDVLWAFAERRLPVDASPAQRLSVARRSG